MYNDNSSGSNRVSTAAPERSSDIWTFNERLYDRLFAWNLANMITGLILRKGRGFFRALGWQSIGWAFSNLATSIFASRAKMKHKAELADPYAPDVQLEEKRKLQRQLAINAGLDILYILGGFRSLRRAFLKPRRMGSSIGMIVQGALLFMFNTRTLRALLTWRQRRAGDSDYAAAD